MTHQEGSIQTQNGFFPDLASICPNPDPLQLHGKQCYGSGMFIPDPTFSIPDPGFEFFSIPDPGSTSKNLGILTQKIVF
jgi:hypothetical protein